MTQAQAALPLSTRRLHTAATMAYLDVQLLHAEAESKIKEEKKHRTGRGHPGEPLKT